MGVFTAGADDAASARNYGWLLERIKEKNPHLSDAEIRAHVSAAMTSSSPTGVSTEAPARGGVDDDDIRQAIHDLQSHDEVRAIGARGLLADPGSGVSDGFSGFLSGAPSDPLGPPVFTTPLSSAGLGSDGPVPAIAADLEFGSDGRHRQGITHYGSAGMSDMGAGNPTDMEYPVYPNTNPPGLGDDPVFKPYMTEEERDRRWLNTQIPYETTGDFLTSEDQKILPGDWDGDLEDLVAVPSPEDIAAVPPPTDRTTGTSGPVPLPSATPAAMETEVKENPMNGLQRFAHETFGIEQDNMADIGKALMVMGAATMAGGSPHLGVNLGRGVAAGVSSYDNTKEKKSEMGLKEEAMRMERELHNLSKQRLEQQVKAGRISLEDAEKAANDPLGWMTKEQRAEENHLLTYGGGLTPEQILKYRFPEVFEGGYVE